MPFGYRLRSGIFERCSDAIRYIIKHGYPNLLNYIDDLIYIDLPSKIHPFGYPNLLNYIDDLIYIDLPSKIHQAYHFLLSLLQDLGLQVSQSKLIPLHTEVTCLSIVANTINKTVSIPPEKSQEIHNTCTQWTSKATCTKRFLGSPMMLPILNCRNNFTLTSIGLTYFSNNIMGSLSLTISQLISKCT